MSSERGSKKMINGSEVYTIRNFPADKDKPGSAAMFETVDGSWILYNGQPVTDSALFDFLPAEHKERAVRWHERRVAGIPEPPNAPTPVPQSDVLAEILSAVKGLSNRIDALEGQGAPEPEEAVSTKGPGKGNWGKKKAEDKGENALKEMGLQE